MMNTSVYATFRAILLNHNTKDFKYLLAISGGVDSMVLLDLFRQTSAQFQVAHCNFQLRGDDSLGDEEFVRLYCGKYQIPFHSIRFDVEAFKQTGNYSTEMACRELRYNWFEELMGQNHCDYLVTAHHLNDNLETFLINLSRGTGLKGLTGMQISTENLFRPLIECTKASILEYAESNDLQWREDYTNQTDEYTRNKIRHHITPILQEIHPNFEGNFLKSLQYLNDTADFVQDQIAQIRAELIPDSSYSLIPISKLYELKNRDFVQFQLFENYGFKSIHLINQLKIASNSSELKSSTHRLIKDREFLILKEIESTLVDEIDIRQEQIAINSLILRFVQSKEKDAEALETVDADLIQFPIRLRKPKEGDFFYPLGMKGQKKLLSKFFKDLKLSKIEKENVWLLVDLMDQIIWVVGHRLDERFKIKEESNNFLNIIEC